MNSCQQSQPSPQCTIGKKVRSLTPQQCKPPLNSINRLLLTPCRRLGLTRKSPGSSIANRSSPMHTSHMSPDAINHGSVSLDSSKAKSRIGRRVNLEYETSNENEVSHNPSVNKGKLLNFQSKLEDAVSDSTTDFEKDFEDSKIQYSDRNTLVSDTCKLGGTREGNVSTSKLLDPSADIFDRQLLCSEDITKEMLDRLHQTVKQKEEKVAELKLGQLYKKKHDLSQLDVLTRRWRVGCQEALQELLSQLQIQGYSLNMFQLLANLGIPHGVVGFNQDKEDFE